MEISLPTKVPIKMSERSAFIQKNHQNAVRSCCFFLFLFLFIRVFKTAACYKITYGGLNQHIIQLSAGR